MNINHLRSILPLLAMLGLLGLQACEIPKGEPNYPDPMAENYEKTGGSVLGSPGFKLFDDQAAEETPGVGLAVNAYLWRAALDTISFMPLSQVDAFGGVILTDWYSQPETPNSRMRVNIYILGQELRANGLRVSTFRQEKNQKGEWVDAIVQQMVSTQLEDAILTRARQLRIAADAPQK